MRTIRTSTLAIGLVALMSTAGFAATAPNAANPAYTRVQPVRTHAVTGIVTFVRSNRLVIRRSGREMAFMLRPSTERLGHVRVGSIVDVRYRSDSNRRIATAVTVEPAPVTIPAD